MVEADSPFKQIPTSILDTYKVIELIDMLSISIGWEPFTVIHPTLLQAQILGFCVSCGVKMKSICHG